MKNKHISLIGCGWLGHDLAQSMAAQNFSVIGTTSGKNPSPYLPLDLKECPIVPDVILSTDYVVYLIPPLEFSFVKNFFDQIPLDKKIIFISSTSVYGKHLGAVDENFELNDKTTSSPLLVETENYLRSRFIHLTVLRPGGLYGKKRHPVFFLQGKKDLKTGLELLHLAHLNDVMGAIKSVIDKDIWGETFNIVSDLRVIKKEYYTAMALKLKLPPPVYEIIPSDKPETSISNLKSKNLLGLNYIDPNGFCTSSA